MYERTINGWLVRGLRITPEEHNYNIISEAISTDNVSEEYLQERLGYLAPISIDGKSKIIDFLKF